MNIAFALMDTPLTALPFPAMSVPYIRVYV